MERAQVFLELDLNKYSVSVDLLVNGKDCCGNGSHLWRFLGLTSPEMETAPIPVTKSSKIVSFHPLRAIFRVASANFINKRPRDTGKKQSNITMNNNKRYFHGTSPAEPEINGPPKGAAMVNPSLA